MLVPIRNLLDMGGGMAPAEPPVPDCHWFTGRSDEWFTGRSDEWFTGRSDEWFTPPEECT